MLDSWRGIAALLVATYHLQIFGHFYAVSLIRDAWLFVDFFFVLSGFVLAHAYADRLTNSEEFRIFAIRRFGRLWPLHIATAAFVALTEALKLGLSQSGLVRFEVPAFAADDWTWTMVAANLLMLHGLGVPGAAPLNGPSWTIATEFYAYLVFATVCLCRSETCGSWTWWRCCALQRSWEWPASPIGWSSIRHDDSSTILPCGYARSPRTVDRRASGDEASPVGAKRDFVK